MSELQMSVITPTGGQDPDMCVDDLKSSLKTTAKNLKGKIKRIKVVENSIQFTIEPNSVAEKIIDSIRSDLGVEVKAVSSPMSAFAEKYGLGHTSSAK